MKKYELDALLDRVQAMGPPPCFCTHTEPGTVFLAVNTAAGAAVLAIDAKEWDVIRAAQLLGAPVPLALQRMIRETQAGHWTRAAQERRAQEEAAAAARAEKEAAAARSEKKRPRP